MRTRACVRLQAHLCSGGHAHKHARTHTHKHTRTHDATDLAPVVCVLRIVRREGGLNAVFGDPQEKGFSAGVYPDVYSVLKHRLGVFFGVCGGGHACVEGGGGASVRMVSSTQPAWQAEWGEASEGWRWQWERPRPLRVIVSMPVV